MLTVTPMPVQVVSAVLYMNEEDLLHVRFLELYDVVDHFIVMESPVTFQGDPKPLLFQKEVCRRFAAFSNNVVHVVVSSITNSSSLPETGASEDWAREHASRVGGAEAAGEGGQMAGRADKGCRLPQLHAPLHVPCKPACAASAHTPCTSPLLPTPLTSLACPVHCRAHGALLPCLPALVCRPSLRPPVPLPRLLKNLQNALQAAVSLLKLQPDDIMLTSDADEIPTAAAVQLGTNYLLNNLVSLATEADVIPIVEFSLKAYYYSLFHTYVSEGCRCPDDHQRGTWPAWPACGLECSSWPFSRMPRMQGNAGGAKMFPLWSTSICSFQDIRFTDKCSQAKVGSFAARPHASSITRSCLLADRHLLTLTFHPAPALLPDACYRHLFNQRRRASTPHSSSLLTALQQSSSPMPIGNLQQRTT